MPIALFRVDERLIHGQVTMAWGGVLRPDLYLVVDDLLAESEWEAELYRLGVPPGSDATFLAVDEARTRLAELRRGSQVIVLLTRSVKVMAELGRDGGLEGVEINLGGLHDAPERDEVLTYLYLDDGERAAIRRLLDSGATVTARDLPNTPKTGVERILKPR